MSDIRQLAIFIQQVAECRTPVIINVEDLPPGISPTEITEFIAAAAEVPLITFDINHMDDRSASHQILEAIKTGSWLLFNLSHFQGVEGLLRDLGRRLFTIMPNDSTRPLMSRFRLLMAMRRDTPKSAVFRKLALPLPIHPSFVVQPADSDDLFAKTSAAPRPVTECQVGALFYRTDDNDIEKVASLPQRVAPRPRPHTSPVRPSSSASHSTYTNSYTSAASEAEKDLFEKYASNVSQAVFGHLMRSYYTMGDTTARRMAKAFRDITEKGSIEERKTPTSGKRFPNVEDESSEGLVFEGPPDSLGMRPALWRGLAVWTVPMHPSASLPPSGWPQHPSLHCPVGVYDGTYLLYSELVFGVEPVVTSTKQVLRIVGAIATGLMVLRDAGLAHQHLSIGAIVYSREQLDRVMLLVTNQVAPYTPNEAGVLVAPCGTTPTLYLSPSAAIHGERGFADDAWALGVLLWQLLSLLYSGDPDPYAGYAAADILSAKDYHPDNYFVLPMGVPNDIGFIWESIGRRCLCLDPSKRMTLSQVSKRVAL